MLTNMLIDDIMSVTTLWSSIGHPVVVVLTKCKVLFCSCRLHMYSSITGDPESEGKQL